MTNLYARVSRQGGDIEKQLRQLYARVLAAGNGCETMPMEAAEALARQEPLNVIVEQLDGHPDLDAILKDYNDE